MNERQPYEHRIAEKLQQLPSPDVETSWQKMKRLLDDNQQPKSGAGNNGPGSWWRTGLIALVVITGLWLYTENKKSPGKETAIGKQDKTDAITAATPAANSSEKTNKESVGISGKKQTITNDKTATLNEIPVNGNKENKLEKDNGVTGNDLPVPDITKQNVLANEKIDFETPTDTKIVTGRKKTYGKDITTAASAVNNNKVAKADIKLNKKNNVLPGNYRYSTKHHQPTDIKNNRSPDQQPVVASNQEKRGKNSYYNKNNVSIKEGNIQAFDAVNNGQEEKTNSGLTITGKTVEELMAKRNAAYESLQLSIISNEHSLINTFLSVGDSIEAEVDGSTLLSKQTKDLARRAKLVYEEEALAKKTRKSLKLDLTNVFKPFSLHIDAEPWWAAGFALNNTVAVNAQNRYNYNINAKSGVLGDYIPSPYVQFHLNDYVYMQTELNLSTPQLTPQLLLYQKNAEMAGAAGFSQQKSIYVQKLYYFNWPVSLHYSPINNLYFAAGLQFSSFQSGLALIQNKRYVTQTGNPDNPVSVDNSIQKFKDDSLAAKLSPTEWRWQTGADYYWNRFTIGLRYNKAFKDLLNVNVSSSLPLTTNRNSAFLFFMRYNLFEGRNKNNAGSQKSLVRY